jgi:rSAM/selenodomain-associated transferase 2
MMLASPYLSVVVPVLNEAALIADFLAHLRQIAPEAEIIVVDGGSDDATATIAGTRADRVLRAAQGRAVQMNAGAKVARGEVIWFLHVDLLLPLNALEMIEATLQDRRCVGGCFRLRFPRPEPIYRISDSLGNLGVEVFGFALGDHGIFCRRNIFLKVGGYPEVPILEDAEIYRRLHRVGRMIQLRPEIVCSPRTYEKHGPYRTTAVYFLILVLYVAGVSILSLSRIHGWFRQTKMSRTATLGQNGNFETRPRRFAWLR